MLKVSNNLLASAVKNASIQEILFARQCQQWRYQSTVTASSESLDASCHNEEWQQAKPFEEIPTMSTWQTLRNFMPGGKYNKLDSSEFLFAFKSDMGPIARMRGTFGKPDSIMTYNPEDFEKALRNEGTWPNRPGMDTLQYHRSVLRSDYFQGVEGLIGTQDEKWGSFRSIVNPIMMQPKNVRLYFKKMGAVNQEFMDRIREIRDPHTLEMPSNFEEEINRWTLESVSVVALDKQLGLIKQNRDNPMAKKLFNALTEFFTLSVFIEVRPSIWKYYKTPTFKKLMLSLDNINDVIQSYVEEALQRLEENAAKGVPEKPDNEKSVLEKLAKIDKRVATVMAMDTLMAGVDTTTTTFTGLLLCLAKNPEKQMKLREEVMKILPNKDSEFNEAAFNNMPYLRACIKESLRVYPLANGNARKTAKDVVLSGYRVPKGSFVFMVSACLMKDDAHFPRANEYLPERWLREEKGQEATAGQCPRSLKPSSPFVYLPFGFGSRSCIGRRIAEMELELGIARLIRNFNVEFNYPTDKAFKSILFNVPNIPLKFKFTDVEK